MKDRFGDEIKLNDKVSWFKINRFTQEIFTGLVVGFTPAYVEIQTNLEDIQYTIRRKSTKLLLTTNDPRFKIGEIIKI
jgi:hypothetical protein